MVVGAATPDCEAGLRLRCAVVTPCPHLRLGPPFQAIAFATRSSACSSRPDRRLMGRKESSRQPSRDETFIGLSPLSAGYPVSKREGVDCLLNAQQPPGRRRAKGRPSLCMGWSNTHITWSKHVGSRDPGSARSADPFWPFCRLAVITP